MVDLEIKSGHQLSSCPYPGEGRSEAHVAASLEGVLWKEMLIYDDICWYPLVISHSCGNFIKFPMYFDVFDLLNIANFPWLCYRRATFFHFLSNSCLQHQKSPSVPWFWGLISDHPQQSASMLVLYKCQPRIKQPRGWFNPARHYMGVDQNIVAGVLLEMTLRPPLRFLALFRDFTVFHYID